MLMQSVRPCTDCLGAGSRGRADSALMLSPSQQTPSSTKGACDPEPRPRQPVPVAGLRSVTNHFRRDCTIRSEGPRAGRPQRSDSAFPYATTADAGLGFRSCGRPQRLRCRARCLHRYCTCRPGASSVHCSPAYSDPDCSGQSLSHSWRSPCNVSRQLVAIHPADLLATFATLRHLVLLGGVSRFPRHRTARPRSTVVRTPLRTSRCADPVLRSRPAATPSRRAREPCFVAHRVYLRLLPRDVAVCTSEDSTCCPDSAAHWPTPASAPSRPSLEVLA